MHKKIPNFIIIFNNYIFIIIFLSIFLFLMYQIYFVEFYDEKIKIILNKKKKIEKNNQEYYFLDKKKKIENTKNIKGKIKKIYFKYKNIKNIIGKNNFNQILKINNNLINIKKGQRIYYIFNNEKKIIFLIWRLSKNEMYIYSNNKYNNDYKFFKIKSQNNIINKINYGFISKNKNFISTTIGMGLNKKEVNYIIKLLQWKLNFKNLKYNDNFCILTSYKILNKNYKDKKNKLLAIQINNKKQNYYAIRAINRKFYDDKGYGLSNVFLRFPTKKIYRISSNFNFYRINPVTGYIAPHKGVDFALPLDTPVLAASNGKVTLAKNSHYAGNYIIIKHNNHYLTRYMHLNKVLVHQGQKVKIGDKIALSGNTGRSTGPHLHYEIWINQKAINPLNISLPSNDYLIGKNKEKYLKEIKNIKLQLFY